MILSNNIIAFSYLIACVFIILGLNRLSRPETARWGNYFSIIGMVIAVGITLLNPAVKSYGFIVAGLVIGGIIGTLIALRIKMTAVPQLVAMLHSFVGLTAVLIAFGIFLDRSQNGTLTTVLTLELFAGIFIGAVTFTGSLLAFGKLQALIRSRPVLFKGQHWLNLALGLVIIALGVDFILYHQLQSLLLLTAFALLLGVMLILPIGGPDMPVIISMLNSYSGWAAAATGFTLGNNLLILAGALVGSSGAILSYIMCRAMNRTLLNVVLGGFGSHANDQEISAYSSAAEKGVKTASVDDAVFLMENANKVIIVPGYGMAVAQAQQSVKKLFDHLESLGVKVNFAIHPVAGRMPGHMNVLLAEADIPYDRVIAMEEINPEFSETDVVLVVGANDVTNPAAKNDQSSPIYGMPILEVENAKHIFFVKRSMKPGYSGVENQLFHRDNCSLIFGDAKDICQQMVIEFLVAA